MPVVKLPDGTLVQLPDQPETEKSYLPGFAAESGKAVLRGALSAPLNLLEGLGGVFNPAPIKAPQPVLEFLRKKLNQAIPPEEGTYYRMLEGAGGGAVGVPGSPIIGALSGAAGAGAEDLTNRFLKDQNPALRKVASTAAGLAAGGLTGYTLGRPSNTPQTAKDRALEDTNTLTNLSLNRLGPQVDINQQAQNAEAAAQQFLRNIREQRTNAFEGIVDGETVRPFHLSMVNQGLRRLASQPGTRQSEADALRAMANALRDSNGNYLTDLGQISLSLKSMRDNPPSPNAATSTAIPANDMAGAFRTAQQAVGEVNDALPRANNVYRYATRTMLDPAMESPVGKIADRNPNSPVYPTPASRLNAIVDNQSPQGVGQTMLQLQTGGADPQALARAILQRKLEAGGMSPGNKVYGAPGSDVESAIDALVSAAQRDPQAVRAPLRAADTLAQTLPPAGNLSEAVSVHPKGISLRGIFRPGQNQQTIAGKDLQRQIAEIMSTANPEELAQLHRLAMFDKNVRMAMSLQGTYAPFVGQDKEQ